MFLALGSNKPGFDDSTLGRVLEVGRAATKGWGVGDKGPAAWSGPGAKSLLSVLMAQRSTISGRSVHNEPPSVLLPNGRGGRGVERFAATSGALACTGFRGAGEGGGQGMEHRSACSAAQHRSNTSNDL